MTAVEYLEGLDLGAISQAAQTIVQVGVVVAVSFAAFAVVAKLIRLVGKGR